MKNKAFVLPCIAVAIFAFISLTAFTYNTNPKAKKSTEKIEWLNINQAIAKNEKEPRKILIDIYADWCGWCKRLDKQTFGHPDIAAYVNENYYAVKLNAEERETIEVFDEKYKYKKNGRSGANELAIELMEGQMSLPSVVILDEEFAKLTIIPGFMPPKDMDAALQYFGEGYFDKGIKWGIFEKNFKSSIK